MKAGYEKNKTFVNLLISYFIVLFVPIIVIMSTVSELTAGNFFGVFGYPLHTDYTAVDSGKAIYRQSGKLQRRSQASDIFIHGKPDRFSR